MTIRERVEEYFLVNEIVDAVEKYERGDMSCLSLMNEIKSCGLSWAGAMRLLEALGVTDEMA